jgi:hypothetical protein
MGRQTWTNLLPSPFKGLLLAPHPAALLYSVMQALQSLAGSGEEAELTPVAHVVIKMKSVMQNRLKGTLHYVDQ